MMVELPLLVLRPDWLIDEQGATLSRVVDEARPAKFRPFARFASRLGPALMNEVKIRRRSMHQVALGAIRFLTPEFAAVIRLLSFLEVRPIG